MNANPVGNPVEAKANRSPRKPYTAPVLTVFGDVAALTQSSTGCNNNDSSGCTAAAGSTMGPMA